MNIVGGGGTGTAGGLSGLISRFEQAGLGHIAQSWVGNGPKQPISPEQLHSVFGENQVQNMAGQAGMAPGDFLSQLSQHLPSVVDGMTPNGQVPDEVRSPSEIADDRCSDSKANARRNASTEILFSEGAPCR